MTLRLSLVLLACSLGAVAACAGPSGSVFKADGDTGGASGAPGGEGQGGEAGGAGEPGGDGSAGKGLAGQGGAAGMMMQASAGHAGMHAGGSGAQAGEGGAWGGGAGGQSAQGGVGQGGAGGAALAGGAGQGGAAQAGAQQGGGGQGGAGGAAQGGSGQGGAGQAGSGGSAQGGAGQAGAGQGGVGQGGVGQGGAGQGGQGALQTGPVSNNSAVLGGIPLGTQSASNDQLRHKIAVTVIGLEPGLSLGQGWVTRGSTSNNDARFIVELRNDAAEGFCFAKLESVTFRDGGGAMLPSSLSFMYLLGSVGDAGAVQTATCIAPGETAYFTSLEDNMFAEVTALEAAFSFAAPLIGQPSSSLVPEGYEWVQGGFSSSIKTSFKNVGTAQAELSTTSMYVLLDDVGEPLFWGYLADITPADGLVAAGASGQANAGIVNFNGTASHVRPFLDFADAP